jgi:hypothetical protein
MNAAKQASAKNKVKLETVLSFTPRTDGSSASSSSFIFGGTAAMRAGHFFARLLTA